MSKPDSGEASKPDNAPPYSFNYDYATSMRAPPPTYEQSQQQGADSAPAAMPMHIPSNQYYGMMHHQQLQQGQQEYGLVGPSTSAEATAAHVLNIDPRASLRTTVSGAVVVPPPPPGCLPTPAQLAAMQGKPVVVQQKKRSFF
ncbi:uncharacterized protein LOC6575731 [Drosophila mojavensis]|uniref:DAZ-associated protein 2 n=1 Tax=Drosophila mojavensis TaxID=7230 RepID=B4KGX8_DROMO|nr:uncharacterized protein LOC6575731 [Drosophila mojavensis]EDW11178.1 uncharacterized protein Dmoj_GI17013 [Drosophila mojavensis]